MTKQRDQQHQLQMAEQKEILLHLRLELQKQEQNSSGSIQELEKAIYGGGDQQLYK